MRELIREITEAKPASIHDVIPSEFFTRYDSYDYVWSGNCFEWYWAISELIKPKTFLEIGDNNTIREFCTFNRGTAQDQSLTKIGNDNWIMAYVHIAHDCEIKNHTILANNTSLAGHVSIDDYAILGGFTLVHQFCKIGSHIITAVNTVVFKDIPPYVIAAGYDAKPNGINAEGLKRRGFDSKIIAKIKEAYKVLYRQGLSLNEAEEKIKILKNVTFDNIQLPDQDQTRGPKSDRKFRS